MKVRLMTSALGIILFFVVLFAPSKVFYIADLIIAAVAIYEIYSVTGISKKPTLAFAGVLGVALCAVFGFAHLNVLDYGVCLLALTVVIAYIFAVMIFDSKRVKLNDAAIAFFAAVIPSLLFSYLVPLRADENGMFLIVALFAATWCGDAGAYFIGINFGKHKLAPVLSPKKTVEGAVGGIFGSMIGMGIYAFVLHKLNIPCNEAMFIIVGALCAVIGPIGDIATSAIKREFNVKDFGNIFPGHGGMLDRFDSILLTAPLVYFMNEVFGLIG